MAYELPDIVAGSRHTALQITARSATSQSVKSLAGAAVSARITDRTTGATRDATGQLAVSGDGTAGVFTWALSAADVGSVGTFTVQFTATYGDGTADTSFEHLWRVLPKR